MDALLIRLASSDDHVQLARLAALDSAKVPLRPALVAVVEGEVVAALSLRDGHGVADPFRHTSEVVELLQLRAEQLAEQGHHSPMSSLRRALGTLTARLDQRQAE
jgi:hypothetical protein